MMLIPRILVRWLVPAGLVTACCILIYLCAQQVHRQLANDPQIEMAHGAAAKLEGGAAAETVLPSERVDFARSGAPFLTVINDAGATVASSGRLHGDIRTPPAGIAQSARTNGEARVTWQPEVGVRIATVSVRYNGGVVLAGRSLNETEQRIATFGQLVFLAWVGISVGLLVLVAATEYLSNERST